MGTGTMSLAEMRTWMLTNPGAVWGSVVFGGMLAYSFWKQPRADDEDPANREQIRQRQVARYNRERETLQQSARDFFFDGDLLAALQLLAGQMVSLLVVIEQPDQGSITPLSRVWADNSVRQLASSTANQVGEVLPVRVDAASAEAKCLRTMFKIQNLPAVLLLTGSQNFLVPSTLSADQLSTVLSNMILKAKESQLLQDPQALAVAHQTKGEWMCTQLLLSRGSLRPSDFVADPTAAAHTSVAVAAVPAPPAQESSTEWEPPREYLQAQQQQEFEQAMRADQMKEEEQAAAKAAAQHKAEEDAERAQIEEAIALSHQVAKDAGRNHVANRLTKEPVQDETPGIATVVFSLGAKGNVTRRFRPDESLQLLHDFLWAEHEIEHCELVAMGLQLNDNTKSVRDAKLAPKTRVMVQFETDESSEEDEE